MGVFAPFSYLEKNLAPPPALDYQIRSDAYASYVYLAIPGTEFSGSTNFTQNDGAWSDISGDINGGVSSKTISPYTNTYGGYYISGSTNFSSEDYTNSVVTFDGAAAANLSAAQLPFSSDDFVIEAWCQPAEAFNRPPFHKPLLRSFDGTGHLYLDNTANTTVSTTTHRKRMALTGTFNTSGNGVASYSVGTWKHVAFVRSGTTFYAYDDGVLKYSASKSATFGSGTGYEIMGFTYYTNASQSNNENGNWAMQDFRISIGTDRGYVGGFTPPASIIEKVT